MTTSPRAASSESPRAWPNAEGETAGEAPGSAPAEPLLRVVPTQFGGQAILTLVGEVDTSNTGTVREAVEHCLARQPDVLTVDLSGLTYCSAAGLRSLSWALRRAKADNVEFHLISPPPWFRRVITAIQAHDLLAATSAPA